MIFFSFSLHFFVFYFLYLSPGSQVLLYSLIWWFILGDTKINRNKNTWNVLLVFLSFILKMSSLVRCNSNASLRLCLAQLCGAPLSCGICKIAFNCFFGKLEGKKLLFGTEHGSLWWQPESCGAWFFKNKKKNLGPSTTFLSTLFPAIAPSLFFKTVAAAPNAPNYHQIRAQKAIYGLRKRC